MIVEKFKDNPFITPLLYPANEFSAEGLKKMNGAVYKETTPTPSRNSIRVP